MNQHLKHLSCFLFCSVMGSQASVAAATDTWTFEFAPRYWLSTGTYQLNLLGDTNALVSRLTSTSWTGSSAEAFWNLKHNSGLSVKGYIGGGSLSGGQFIDEDFPPGITPYSRTDSIQQDNGLQYASIDLGYHLIQHSVLTVDGFIGYHYWAQTYHAFGAQQVANNPEVIPNNPPIYGPASADINVLTESLNWNALRLGVNGTLLLSSLTINTDIAYTQSHLSAYDYHNLRPDIRGMFEDGAGDGMQWDTMFNWQYTPQLQFGVGGRWWYALTNGLAHFEQTYASGEPQPIKVTQSTYGLLIQAQYQFNDVSSPVDNYSNWEGFYLGPNIGYGTDPAIISNTPVLLSQNLATTPPWSLNVTNQGFLAGGQLGYQSVHQQLLFGLEMDLDYSGITGTNAMTPNNIPITTTVNSQINILGTMRGRFGKLATNDLLVYLTGGLAYADATLSFDQHQPGVNCPYSLVCGVNQTEKQALDGYTAGAGIEFAITPHMTLKAEYLYINLAPIAINTIGQSFEGPVSIQSSAQLSSNTIRLGGNYRL